MKVDRLSSSSWTSSADSHRHVQHAGRRVTSACTGRTTAVLRSRSPSTRPDRLASFSWRGRTLSGEAGDDRDSDGGFSTRSRAISSRAPSSTTAGGLSLGGHRREHESDRGGVQVGSDGAWRSLRESIY
jgi:hypothetical protein